MRIGFRHIDGKVHRVFHTVVSVTGETHEIGTASLAFCHVADSFFNQLLLCQHADYQCTVLHKADGAVLQLSGSVGFGMNIGYLLHLQAAFQADGIIKAPADKENVMGMGKLCREPLDTLPVLQHSLHLFRQGEKLLDVSIVMFLPDLFFDLCSFYSENIDSSKLGAVRFCCGNGNFRPGKRIEHMVSFSGYGGSDHIDDGKRSGTQLLRPTQSSKCIGSFTGLRYHNHQVIFGKKQLSVSKF